MKTIVTAIFAALLSTTVSAADPPPLPAATPTLELRASGLSVPQVAFVGFMDELESIRDDNTDERLSAYVGDTARIRTWLGQMLRNHQAILVFDTHGQIQSERAWQFEIPSQEMRIDFPRLDDSGNVASNVVSGVKSGPRLEIAPIEAETLLLDVSYRPAAFYPDHSQAPYDLSRDLLRSGQLSVPNGQSLVLLTNMDLDPVPLVVISAHDARETVTIHSVWPVPYTATVPRSAAEANPLAEIISADTTQSAAVVQTEPDPSTHLADDVQFLPAGTEFNPSDSAEPVASSNPPADLVAGGTNPASEPESQPTAPSAEGDVRFYPGVGPARLTASGDLVSVPPQPDVSIGGNYIELTPGEPQTIEIREHDTCRVLLPNRIKSVSGFNPEVIDVTSSDPNALLLQSLETGATRLTIVDEEDEALQLTVVVSNDMTDLQLLLERLYPEADIEIIPIHDTVLLRGIVGDPEEVEQIVEIAEQFAPQVLNQLRVGADSAIPAGYRLVTISSSDSHTLTGLLRRGDHVDVLATYRRRSERGVIETVTNTLLEYAEIYALEPGDIRESQHVSLIVLPHHVEAVRSAGQYGELSLSWRHPEDNAESLGLNEEVVNELTNLAASDDSGSPDRQPPPASITSPYPTDVVPPQQGLDFRFLAIGIGSDPECLGEAEVGGLVDILATAPGIGGDVTETIVEHARLMGIVEPKDDNGRFVWVIVYPDDAETIENRMEQPDASFAVAASSVVYQYPDYSGIQSPGPEVQGPGPGVLPNADPNAIPAAEPSESQPSPEHQSDLDALRQDIRALHDDVRRLIEVLEARADHETDDLDDPRTVPNRDDAIDDSDPTAAAIDDGVGLLFFNASWCGPCQRMLPIMSRLENDGFAVQTVDIDQQRELAREHDITSIPTFVFLYDGEEVNRLVGATTENDLRGRLASAAAPRNRDTSSVPKRAWTELGMRIETVAADDEQVADSTYRGAVRISEVREDSPADDAGLRADDLLVGLHIWETVSPENVNFVLNHASVNTFAPLKFYVLRDGETLFGHFPQGSSIGLEFSFPVGYRGAGRFVQLPATPIPPGENEAGTAVDLLPLPARSPESRR